MVLAVDSARGRLTIATRAAYGLAVEAESVIAEHAEDLRACAAATALSANEDMLKAHTEWVKASQIREEATARAGLNASIGRAGSGHWSAIPGLAARIGPACHDVKQMTERFPTEDLKALVAGGMNLPQLRGGMDYEE